jgi:uncharacterized protein YbjT (DUF2867 family)
LGGRLIDSGWAVRGTSRRAAGLEAIEAAGIEAVQADPEQPGTLLELVGDITVVIWLLGSARGEAGLLEAIHGSRLERILEKLVDTPVRGFVYEGAGEAPASLLGRGAAAVRAASETWRVPTAIVEAEPTDPVVWTEAMLAAVLELVSPAGNSI